MHPAVDGSARTADGGGVRRVLVAVPTYRRPEVVGRLLGELPEQHRSLSGRDGRHPVEVDVLVIDNDPDGGARDLVRAHPGVRYVHEPRPGLTAVRNRALDESADADALVFIDDDETPAPGWLAGLVDTWLSTGAAGVSGPVVSLLPDDLDPWIRAGGFFARRYREGLATGAPILEAATSNLLVDLAAVRERGLRFDPQFGLSGGEDSLFTRRLADVRPLRWCAEAVVHDPVAPERLTRAWVCRRALSLANSGARVELALRPSPTTRARLVAGGTVRLIGGGLTAALGRASGSAERSARGARTRWRGAGLLLGGLGLTYLEYGRGRRWRWERPGR
ncbi:hypothetical protein FHX74_003259 [Friedmanniella endophytica]|uniref:Glycosyltransferase 2-like domain-containing protein n=1 Tax=Microlunatus kandeliicorticis TaxID=1759536 RepID=A0A7W3IUQ1_9ACTN|nr:hypothetical protein [Microlunatus kandeliicorticis]